MEREVSGARSILGRIADGHGMLTRKKSGLEQRLFQKGTCNGAGMTVKFPLLRNVTFLPVVMSCQMGKLTGQKLHFCFPFFCPHCLVVPGA